jgi:putative monooxygenase
MLATGTSGASSFMNGITIIAPNAGIPLRFLNCDESVCLLKGRAIAQIDGAEHAFEPGDASFIPAGFHHHFINPSPRDEMRIRWTYASIDATRTIVATGETRWIDSEHGATSGLGSRV